MRELKDFGIIPVDFKTISNKLSQYKSPRDKVSSLKKSNHLIRLKKGLYIVSPETTNKKISKELIANHLYGPSYVSLETALSFYGIIPERVIKTLSVTTKRRKIYHTTLNDFEYKTVPVKYFPIGISQKIVQNSYAYLIATPEKALCDLIVTKPGIRIQSLKAISEFITQDLRADFDVIEQWDLTIINECIKYGYKKTELRLLKSFIANECNI
jgi:predicted transcriptional regulator of viral defense system